jgi:hypothetical protein
MRDREAATDLRLSARTPDGANVFFIANVTPLGAGWLVAAEPLPGDSGLAAMHEAARYRQIGQAAAALLPRMLAQLPPAEREAAAPLAALVDWTHGKPSETVALSPVALLNEAASLAGPVFAAKGVTLRVAPPRGLPKVPGRHPQVLFALTTILFQTLEIARAGDATDARVEKAGEDVEWIVESPFPAAETPAPGFALLAARQIAREHDGDLVRQAREGVGRFILRLPVPSREG